MQHGTRQLRICVTGVVRYTVTPFHNRVHQPVVE